MRYQMGTITVNDNILTAISVVIMSIRSLSENNVHRNIYRTSKMKNDVK